MLTDPEMTNNRPMLLNAVQGAHRTQAERAFLVVRDAIVTGRFPAGKRLLIDQLTAMLDMSKMPIRDALARLEVAGLVETVPHRGSRVTKLSIDDLHDIYRARLAVEPVAVACAAERFGDEDAERASAHLERLNSLSVVEAEVEVWSAHTAFHVALYEAAASPWLMRLVSPLWQTSERYRFATPIEPQSPESRADHGRILRACFAHDAELARRELYAHLARTANVVAVAMGGDPLFELPTRAADETWKLAHSEVANAGSARAGHVHTATRLEGPPSQHI